MKAEELELIIEEGEGYLIEFKEKLSHLDKEMISFANGSGGRIFIGIILKKGQMSWWRYLMTGLKFQALEGL